MAGLTKEQRAAKVAEKEAALKAEIEAKVRAELKSDEKKVEVKAVENVAPKKKNIPTDYMIPVKSGVQGILVYVSKKTYGDEVEWRSYGDVEYIEYGELVSMRNTSKSFFENNWIFFDDSDDYTAQELYEMLKVDKYYKNTVLGEDLDSVFEMTPEEIEKNITPLSKGVKETIALSARTKIESGDLDSNKRIKALESALNVELVMNF